MNALTRIIGPAEGLLYLLLVLATSSASSQPAIEKIGSLGGSFTTAFDLNEKGEVVGNSMIRSDLAQHAFLYQAGSIRDLGTLGGSSATALALNNQSQVVGFSSTAGDLATHAFLHRDGLWFDLAGLGGFQSSAVGINQAGQIIGDSLRPDNMDNHAFRLTDGVLQDLGTLGGSYSSARALNELGQVTGESARPGNAETHAFLHDGQTMRDLGTLGGSFSLGRDLNNAGWVTGESAVLFDAEVHAFLFDGTTLRDLGTLGGSWSTAYALNESGWVVGDSYTADLQYHGFVSDGRTMVDLGSLGGGYSTAYALNSQGQVVGQSFDASGRPRAFLWENGVMTDLNTLLPPDSGWELLSAQLINDVGQIVGLGLYGGALEWFLLAPDTVPPNRPPVAEAGPSSTAEAEGLQTRVRLDGSSSSDPDGDALAFEWTEGDVVLGTDAAIEVPLALGAHLITLRVTDPDGARAQDQLTVTVRDTQPPTVLAVAPTPDTVVPANGKMVAVTVNVSAWDRCDPAPVSRIIAVTGSDGVTAADWLITGPLTVQLLAKSSSPKAERVYTLTLECADQSGNSATATTHVRVPAKGKVKDP